MNEGTKGVTIIKLGGSVITDKKSQVPRLRAKTLQRLAMEIAEFLRSEGQMKNVIVVHGAGSFGHPLAKKYRLDEGYTKKRQLEGFFRTRRSIQILNLYVLEALNKAGLNPVSVAPGSVIECSNRRIMEFNHGIFSAYLNEGFLPVTYGDVVLDSEIGFCICSGDTLVEWLARKLRAEKVIFVVDVDGIYDKEPGTAGARLLEKIRGNQIPEIKKTSRCVDVTGGIKGKIDVISRMSKDISVLVLNGNKKGRLLAGLKGEDVKGTLITPARRR